MLTPGMPKSPGALRAPVVIHVQAPVSPRFSIVLASFLHCFGFVLAHRCFISVFVGSLLRKAQKNADTFDEGNLSHDSDEEQQELISALTEKLTTASK